MASSTASRPAFITTLLASGPHAALTPAHIMANGGYDKALASQIVDARLDPRVESAAHLANGDLYSAHFLVRKMQNDGYGQWLHAILHRFESDYSNTKAWLRDCDEDMLSGFPGFSKQSGGPAGGDKPAHHAAYLLTDKIAILCKSHALSTLVAQYTEREVEAPPAPTKEELEAFETRLGKPGKGAEKDGSDGRAQALAQVEREAWDELVYLIEMLGDKFGWAQGVEGTRAYTAQTEKQKEMIRKMQGGGEGIRKF